MRPVLTALLALGLALGWVPWTGAGASLTGSCPHCCDHGPSHPAPCSASCPLCANAGCTTLPAAAAVWVNFLSERRPADQDWSAAQRRYPPPLPPPRGEVG